MFTAPKRDGVEGSPMADVGATVIARGVVLQGDFASQSDVVIEGEVKGHVSTTMKLTVGPEAKLKADIIANDALVAGMIEGGMSVKRRLDVKSTANIVGDITCETASIEAGAVIQGKVMIGGSGHASVAANAAKKPNA